MKRRYLLLLLFCTLFSFAGQVLATNYKCYFKSSQTIILPNFWTANQLISPIGGTSGAVGLGVTETTAALFPGGQGSEITCDPSPQSNNAVTYTAPDAGMMDSHILSDSGNGQGLLKTNVPGIVYTMQIRCTNDCAGGNQLYLNMPTQPGASVTSDEYVGGGYKNSEPNWDVFFSLYQTPDYRPQTGQTNVMAIPGTIGILKMGDSTANIIRINVTTGSVLFKLNEPTCLTYSINNSNMRDHYDVNFGDFFVSDFDKTSGYTAERRFTLDLYNCSMNSISITVNGAHTADGNTLINQSGTAEGVGVDLAAQLVNSWEAIKVDGSASVGANFSGNDGWYQPYYQIPFSGKLKKIGEIKAGSFSSTATFTISYN